MIAHGNAEHGRLSECTQHSHDALDEVGIVNALDSSDVELGMENRVGACVGALNDIDTGTAVRFVSSAPVDDADHASCKR